VVFSRDTNRTLADPFDFFLNPFSLLRGIEQETRLTVAQPQSNRAVPVVEVADRDGEFVVTAELPGLAAEDVKVEIINRVLTMQGERRPEPGPEIRGEGRARRRYFYREIVLPDGVDASKARRNERWSPARVHPGRTGPGSADSGSDQTDREPAANGFQSKW
jgi:HSP20 family molecular chaperone IbpA